MIRSPTKKNLSSSRQGRRLIYNSIHEGCVLMCERPSAAQGVGSRQREEVRISFFVLRSFLEASIHRKRDVNSNFRLFFLMFFIFDGRYFYPCHTRLTNPLSFLFFFPWYDLNESIYLIR